MYIGLSACMSLCLFVRLLLAVVVLHLVSSVYQTKRLAGTNVSEMTYSFRVASCDEDAVVTYYLLNSVVTIVSVCYIPKYID